jgi:methyl halide transferase
MAANDRLASLPDTDVCKSSVHFLQTSFFDLPTHQEEDLFDFIYDYTFMCALHPSLRTEWAKKMSALLKPGGQLCTLIYPIMPRDGGPPYEVSTSLYQSTLLPEGFTELRLEVLPDELCHAGREGGKSAVGIWRKSEEEEEE